MPRKDPRRQEPRGPTIMQDVCIGEEVKIGIRLAVERFRHDDTKEELPFPSSLSINERAYVHRYCETLGSIKTKSRGNGQNRFITVIKQKTNLGKWTPDVFNFSKTELNHVTQLLQRFPISDKEREELTPITTKRTTPHDGTIERTKGGRLVNTPAQIPPNRSSSDLNKFRQTLPVTKMGDTIIDTINSNTVCLVAGETGSGKTTQVPQLILDDCYEKKKPCRILCTQPRRIAAMSIAERVAAERGERIGTTVGYQIRLESKVSAKTVLTFCTAGVVLRSLVGGDSNLGTVTHILVDEVHERDKFVDFLLLCLREALPKHPDIKIILMSATLNMDLFSNYFSNCPIICVPGNLFDVEEFFLEDVLKWTNYSTKEMKKALQMKKSAKSKDEKLSEMFAIVNPTPTERVDSDFEDDSEITTSDNAEELGEEKEHLDPLVQREMDQLLAEAWLTGNKDLFHQILHLIASENISVDYCQSESSITALMIASGRGFPDMVEHLLDLGANFNVKTANDWTASDFAKQFNQTEVVELLQAYALTSQSTLASAENERTENMELISEEDRRLLSAYQHSIDDEKVDVDLIIELVAKIHSSNEEGAILVFLPGYEDINAIHSRILEDERFSNKGSWRKKINGIVIFTLHSSIQASEQKKVFKAQPSGIRKIILSTNIAETSVTINDVVFVIDCGKVKEKCYDALSNFSMLTSNWISKASALQRKGRAGRCQAGRCYHMFSRPRYEHLQDYPTPEILRLPLQEVCLHTKLLAPPSEPIADFLGKCPQAPPQLSILNAVHLLMEIDALDQHEDLTPLGQHLVDLPCEPRLGKMVLTSVLLKCLDPVLTIVCCLAYRDPFVLPPQPFKKRNVNITRRKLAEQTYSDHFVLLRAFQLWQKAKFDHREHAFCEKNSISSATMYMLVGMRMQILQQLKVSGLVKTHGQGFGSLRDLNTNSENWAVVKACLVAGTYPNIIQKKASSTLATRKDAGKIKFHSSSVISPALTANPTSSQKLMKKAVKDLPSRWVVYDEMSRAGRTSQAKGCTLVSALAVFLFAGPSRVSPYALRDKEPEEDEEQGQNVNIKVFSPDNWLTFYCSAMDSTAGLELRMKLHSLFLNRMKYPQRQWVQADEAVLQTVTSLLTNADASIGLTNPIGVGQRPKQGVLESVTGESVDEFYGGSNYPQPQNQQQYHQQHQQQQQNHQQQHQQQHQHQHQQYQQQHQQQRWSQNQVYKNQTRGGRADFGNRSDFAGQRDNRGNNSPRDACYIIMKGANHKLLEVSQNKRLWATSLGNEARLSKAQMSGRTVYLIFSVQGSGHFQGYAKMASPTTRTRQPEFPSSGLSAVCIVNWVKSAHLPFQLCHHLFNPWNENKKVQESRDGQEIEPSIGQQLLALWDKFDTQLKPFKVGGAHRGGRGNDPATPPPSRGGYRGQAHQRYGPQAKQDKEHQEDTSGSTGGEGARGGRRGGEGRRARPGSSQSSPSPAPSLTSTEGSAGPDNLVNRLQHMSMDGPHTERSPPHTEAQGLLGEPPSGLVPLAGAQANYPMYLQQQALALATAQHYMGNNTSQMGQGVMMNPQQAAALQRIMMVQQRGNQVGGSQHPTDDQHTS